MARSIVADVTLENIDDFFSIGKKITGAKIYSRSSQREQPDLQEAQTTIHQVHVPPYKQ